MLICRYQLRLGAAVAGRPPYRFGGGFIETALPFAATSAAAPVACDRGGLAAYDRFTVLPLDPFSFQFCGLRLG